MSLKFLTSRFNVGELWQSPSPKLCCLPSGDCLQNKLLDFLIEDINCFGFRERVKVGAVETVSGLMASASQQLQ